MRFILFNAIVAGALIYLFSGADQPGADARRSVDDAMSRLAALSEQAAERVADFQEDMTGPTGLPVAADDMPPAAPAPQPAAAPDPAPAQRPAQQDAPAPQAAPATRVAAAPAAETAPAETAPLPEREVATVPTHRVPMPGDTGPVAARPADGPIEIAEPMMSSKDRRKELFSLAQEMEMLYATRVNQ